MYMNWRIDGSGTRMKRVQAACIYQTLIFKQKDELGLSPDSNLSLNRSEVKKYKVSMDKNKTR